jgi:hypothetical protein
VGLILVLVLLAGLVLCVFLLGYVIATPPSDELLDVRHAGAAAHRRLHVLSRHVFDDVLARVDEVQIDTVRSTIDTRDAFEEVQRGRGEAR